MSRGNRRHSILKRFAIGTFFVLFVTGVVSTYIVYRVNVNSLYEKGADLITRAEFHYIETLGDYTYEESYASEDAKYYSDLVNSMHEFCLLSGMDNMYLYTVDPGRTTRTYLFAITADETKEDLLASTRSFGDVSCAPFSPEELRTLDGEIVVEPEEVDNEFGHYYSWYRLVDLPDDKGSAVLGLDESVEWSDRVINNDVALFLLVISGFLVCIAWVEVVLLKRNVVVPIREVTAHMNEFIANGAVSHTLEVRTNDEIGEIAEAFNKMTSDIERYVKRIEQMTEERVAAVTELQVAKRIQQGLVPASKHLEGEGFEAHAFARTARAVGGDFYDLFELEDGRVAFVLADVSGKGMSAALFMSMFMTLLHEKLIKEADPAQALNEANDSVARSNPENMFVTILAAVFDPTTNVLTFANAGHMPPLVVGKGYLDPDPGIALGLFEDADIKNESRVLMPGEGIVLYTDGVTDANDTEKQFFGEERLAQAVATSSGAKEAVETIVATVDAFTGDAEQFDDLTLMSLFAKKSDRTTWKVSLKPELGSFEVVGSYLKELCSDNDAVLKRVMLACDEGFANVVYYSEASAVEFAIECAGSWLVVRMSDDGVPFDPLSYDAKEREFEDLEFGGMGISFIKQSCDEVSYSYENDKNVLEMRFSL